MPTAKTHFSPLDDAAAAGPRVDGGKEPALLTAAAINLQRLAAALPALPSLPLAFAPSCLQGVRVHYSERTLPPYSEAMRTR